MENIKIKTKTSLVVDVETTGLDPFKDRLLGIGLNNGLKQEAYMPITEYPICGIDYKKCYVITHNGKFDAKFLKTDLDIDLPIDFDTQLAHYLLNIDKSNKLENIVKQIFNVSKEDLLQVYNRCSGDNRKTLPKDFYTKIPYSDWEKYSKEDTYWTMELYKYLSLELKKNSTLENWFYLIEIPLANILTKTELTGVKINKDYLKELKIKFERRLKVLEDKLKWLADNTSINLNSSKQLQELMYKKFKFPKLKKTKTGISTDTKTLNKLANQNLFPKVLLEYRELSKLMNSFVDPLLEKVDNNHRIHPTYNQALTKTRRLSCSEPNIQQIPVKTQIGKQLRNAFIADLDKKLLCCDYDQVELRLLAHFSNDLNMLEIYNKQDGDIHAVTMKALNIERAYAKIFNFSMVYGKTAFGLAQDLNCSEAEAQHLINQWFAQFPKVKVYIEQCHADIMKYKGWTQSLAGLPLYCGNPHTESKAEFYHVLRNSVNYPIQASSQDILKRAVVQIYNINHIYPLLLVHDELVYEIPNTEITRLTKGEKNIIFNMEHAWKLKVPLKVQWSVADNWCKK